MVPHLRMSLRGIMGMGITTYRTGVKLFISTVDLLIDIDLVLFVFFFLSGMNIQAISNWGWGSAVFLFFVHFLRLGLLGCFSVYLFIWFGWLHF